MLQSAEAFPYGKRQSDPWTSTSAAVCVYMCFLCWTSELTEPFSLELLWHWTIYFQVSCYGINFNKISIFTASVYTQVLCTSYHINHTTCFDWNQPSSGGFEPCFAFHVCIRLNIVKMQCLDALNYNVYTISSTIYVILYWYTGISAVMHKIRFNC
jgi:hypothetical protein